MLWETGGCGSFYAISVEHESFKGLTTIKQHRLVNDLLKDDIKDMHGLQVSLPPHFLTGRLGTRVDIG